MGRRRKQYEGSGESEWKMFWQKLALSCLTICGILTTGMVRRFIGDFDKMATNVGQLTHDVQTAIKDQKDLKTAQEKLETRVNALELIQSSK